MYKRQIFIWRLKLYVKWNRTQMNNGSALCHCNGFHNVANFKQIAFDERQFQFGNAAVRLWQNNVGAGDVVAFFVQVLRNIVAQLAGSTGRCV